MASLGGSRIVVSSAGMVKMKPIVVSIPHASTYIPEDIRVLLKQDEKALMHDPDLYTERIYNADGVVIVEAKHSRIISDVNRAPDEMYTVGMRRSEGVVLLSLTDGSDVFKTDPSLELMEQWVQRFHASFHAELTQAMKHASFLIDGHSMWSVGPRSKADSGVLRPDVVLGNRHYTTCDAETTQFFRHAFEHLGYTVAINTPYMGRYTVGVHCSRLGVPGIQIEFSRALYMNEDTLVPHDDAIERLHRQFQDIVDQFSAWHAQRPAPHLCDLTS